MPNELVFFLYVAIIAAFTAIASRLGKEALIGWMGLELILANFFILKQVDLFHFTVTASDAFAVGAFLTLNIIQERFGKEEASRSSIVSLFMQGSFVILSLAHLAYKPSASDWSHDAYALLLTPAPRIVISSLLVFFIAQRIDIWLFNKIKERTSLSFPVRSSVTMLFSQGVDTLLFTLFALSGMAASLTDIMLFSYTVKAILILSLNPALAFTRKIYA